jgi:regulator of RNase E activity RraA
VENAIDIDRLADSSYSAAISDACDLLGYRAQVAAPAIAPLAGLATGGILVGWARTARSVAVDEPPARPYGREIDFIDSLRPGDVVVADASHAPAAFWGELFSTAASARGARGAVVDGLIRDRDRIDEVGFPVFASGSQPTDSLGRISIADVDVPVEVAGVEVRSGDLVVADADGIVFVPAPIAHAVAEAAMSKAGVETDARQMLRSGSLLADAWEKYRVL